MATLDGNHLKTIKDLIEVTIEEVIDRKGIATKAHIGNLQTKDEFHGKMDQVMGELKAIREEQTPLTHRVANHEDRSEKNRVPA